MARASRCVYPLEQGGLNAAHPYENPTPLTNTLHMLSMLLIPAALTGTAEQHGNANFTPIHVDQQPPALQAGGNTEGKETRFVIIVASIPLALKGVRYRAERAQRLLSRNLLIYGAGGAVAPFIGIKLIDSVIALLL